MAYADYYGIGQKGHRVDERKLRDAMRKIVVHARAPKGSHDRMTKEQLMQQIDILEAAGLDLDWTVYYP